MSNASSVIRLRGVRHHNLKNFDLDLPLRRLIVITGLSGSGKSSLAFDTLYAEGQRRYIETFSPYARQFFDRMDKPQVDSIEGIPPAIAIEQRNTVRTTRSTVGTMTEICDYMKLLWPHVAQLYCRQCGELVRKDLPLEIWAALWAEAEAAGMANSNQLLAARLTPRGCETSGAVNGGMKGRGAHRDESVSQPGGSKARELVITFELPLSAKLSLQESLTLVAKQGYQRLMLNSRVVRVEDALPALQQARPNALEVVQDRLPLTEANRARFAEACEQAYHFGKGKLAVHWLAGGRVPSASSSVVRRVFSNRFHCAKCDLDYREPSPALFSFNHPLGACPTCRGFGRTISIDYNLAMPDRRRTLAQGVVKPWLSGISAECQDDLLKFCRLRGVPTNVPFDQLPAKWQQWVINGDPDYGRNARHEWPHAWYGVKGYFRWLESRAYKMHVRVLLSRYRSYQPCPDCHGQRFRPESLAYKLALADLKTDLNASTAASASQTALSLAGFYAMPIRDALKVIEALAAQRPPVPGDPVRFVLEEVQARLGYLVEVGLGYLTLDRPTRTLSGGETERVNLTTCLGARLVNTLFVLDEPTVGLHPRDTARLVRIMERLRAAGNTVVVVEHEPAVMRAADQIVDLGPGHGETGGQVVFQGTFADLLRCEASLTGQYLSGRKRIEIPVRRPVHELGRKPRPAPGPVSHTAHPPKPSVAAGKDASRDACQPCLTLAHATCHNLRDFSVQIPLGRLVCVTGVSGSGKTTLVREVLLPALQSKLRPFSPAASRFPLGEDSQDDVDTTNTSGADGPLAILTGYESLGQVVLVDQSPLGKTPRSNPAVYIGAFDDIRALFADSEPARQRGLKASAFSFNSPQGQCERCRGAGFEKIEMQFLSDVFIRCPDCGGRRYRPHVLEVAVSPPAHPGTHKTSGGAAPEPTQSQATFQRAQAFTIADLLDATVDEAIAFLGAFPNSRSARRAADRLRLLQDIGLGYLRLGQPINTLSGGESQRLKLASHLAQSMPPGSAWSRSSPAPGSQNGCPTPRSQSNLDSGNPPPSTLFLFDEPTTGLHYADVARLLQVLQRLVDHGHSVLVIEHNLELIKCADWVIDLGPDAGDQGGRLVAAGTPEQIAACPQSHTGAALRELGLGCE